MAKFAKRLFAGALAAAVALTTVISSDMTALAAKTKATKIKGSTYTTADLIWEDNFNGNKLNTRYWNYEAHEPGWVNQEWQSYPSQEENEKTQNIYVKDGKLTIQAKKTKNEDGTYSYTSGRINTQNKVDTKYGRFEARIKMPKGKGFLPAFWMMPTDENLYGQWPKCGEIDITEVLGDKPNTAHSTLHFGEPHKQKQGTYTLEKGTFNDDFHVYACEWEPGEMRFYIDNKLFYTENDWFTKKEGFDEVAYPAPYDQPFYIILNLAVGGSWVGYPDKTTKFDENAQMVVDYVKVYQKDSYKENVKKPENKVTVRKPAKDGNYVVNSSFAKSEKLNDGKDWEFMTAGTGKASAKISKKALHITTKNAGDLDYSVQVVQANIPMEKGYQYKLSFDAYADKNRTIKTGITAPDNGYIRYFNDTTVNLTTKKKTYSYTFDMKSDTDPNGRVEFNLGNQGSTAGVHISNVKVVRVKKISLKEEKTVRPDGNYVYNGEFQEGADRLNYWTVKKAKGVTVKVTNTNNVRQLKAVVPASVKKASDVTLKQTKIAIKGGKTYAFSFDAKRTGAKDQTMTVKLAGKTYKVKLTGKMKNYKFELNPDKGIKNATLEFQLGTKGTTVIDNVRIMESGLIINGDFSAGLTGFEPWANNPSDISYVVDTLNEDSAFCMDIKDTGDQDWHVQLKQTGIKLEKGQSYKVSFKVKGTMERDIKFAFQRNGLVRKTADGAEDWTVYFEDGQIPVTKKWTTYSAIFEMGEGDDADTSMSFSLGAVGGKRITDKHTVMIDDIVLEKTDEKPEKEEDDSLILNGHFNKGLAPFEAWAHEAATMESSVNKDKEFEATISNTGDQDWHVQLKQVNIPLESGQTYTFSFRAKSDMDREIKYAFQKDGNKHNDDWTVYFEESNIPVTKEWKTYTTVFKMNNASDKEASFSFNLGAVGKQIKEKHTVTIDDVSLKVATEEEKKKVKNETAGGGYNYSTNSEGNSGSQTTKLETLSDGPIAAGNITNNAGENRDVEASVADGNVTIKITSENDGVSFAAADIVVPVAKADTITPNVSSKVQVKVGSSATRSLMSLMPKNMFRSSEGEPNIKFAVKGENIEGLSYLKDVNGNDSIPLSSEQKTVELICEPLTEEQLIGATIVICVGEVKSKEIVVSDVSKAEFTNTLGGNETWQAQIPASVQGGTAANATSTMLSNGFRFEITNPGNKTHCIQIGKDIASIVKGATYEYSFKAKVVEEGKTWTVKSCVQPGESKGWYDGNTGASVLKSQSFDSKGEVIRKKFVAAENDSRDDGIQLVISLGHQDEDNVTPWTENYGKVTVEITDIRFVKISDPKTPDTSGETSDTVTIGTDDSLVKLTADGKIFKNGAAGVVKETSNSGEVQIKITNAGANADAVKIATGDAIRLKPNTKYEYSFDIVSDKEWNFGVFMQNTTTDNWAPWADTYDTAGTSSKKITKEFTTTNNADGLRFTFQLGHKPVDDWNTTASNILGDGESVTLTISNFKIVEKQDSAGETGGDGSDSDSDSTSSESVTIGTDDSAFKLIVDGSVFTTPAAGVVKSTENSNEVKIKITNAGANADAVKIATGDAIRLKPNTKYEYSFDIVSDKEWNFGVFMQNTTTDNWAPWADTYDTAGTSSKKITKEFTTTNNADGLRFTFQLGHKPVDDWNTTASNILGDGESVTLTISNFKIVEK